ncbi:MAG: type II toxin-antitoxin system HigB family toxin [Chloroflexota bacterium]|nr:type II toxin-antitoxin system HigB family toxin [Chloroflexota bacterium]
MRVISRRRLREFWERHPQSKVALVAWYRIAKCRSWHSMADVKRDFPHADAVGQWMVFNIGGNDFRLVVDIVYRGQAVYVKSVDGLPLTPRHRQVLRNDANARRTNGELEPNNRGLGQYSDQATNEARRPRGRYGSIQSETRQQQGGRNRPLL